MKNSTKEKLTLVKPLLEETIKKVTNGLVLDKLNNFLETFDNKTESEKFNVYDMINNTDFDIHNTLVEKYGSEKLSKHDVRNILDTKYTLLEEILTMNFLRPYRNTLAEILEDSTYEIKVMDRKKKIHNIS